MAVNGELEIGTGSEVLASTEDQGRGGDVLLSGESVSVSGGASVTVGSTGPGESGAVWIEAVGSDERYAINVVSAAPEPPEKFENDWVVEVTTVNGEPAAEAVLTRAEPFMPVHGHDGTFSPDVSRAERVGRWLVERINMWMGGPWEVRFWVSDGSGGPEERVVFDVCIPD